MRSLRSRTYVFAFLPVVLALSGCGMGSKGGVKSASTTQATGHKVTATETEYKIQLSQTQLQPGPTTFVAVNKGKVGHSLEVVGPGVSGRRISGSIAPRSSGTLTVTLQKGSYQVFCPIDGHKGLGMLTRVTVGGTSTNSPAPAMTTTSGGSSGGGIGY